MFHEIPDSSVVLRSGGIYKQTTLYTHNSQIFAKANGGFVKLFKYSNGTSKPNVAWEEVKLPYDVEFDMTGVMSVPMAEKYPPLQAVA